MQAAPTGKTGPPASKSNPLGFYFNKDLAVAAARKSVGGVPHLERPVGQNKAALGYYFNKHKPQSVDIQQADSTSDQQSVDAALTDTAAEGKSSRQGKGLSSIIQTSVYLHQDGQLPRGKAGTTSSEHDARQEAVKGRSSSANGLAVNLTAVEFKPLTISLNTDDV